MPDLSITSSILLFAVSGLLIWYFSNKLAGVVDAIDERWNLGDAFGGTIMLSVVTNLPEVVIVTTGTLQGNTAMALGNILGGIAMQTLLLVLFDHAAGRQESRPLCTLASSPAALIQGVFLCIILALVIAGAQFNQSFVAHRISPVETGIAITWLLTLWLLHRTGHHKAAQTSPRPTREPSSAKALPTKHQLIASLLFIGAIILTFGYVLATTSEAIADHFGLSGVVFGATVLAFVTSLPEISSGLAYVKQREYAPIMADILGGNAFLPVLFLLANLLAGRSILTEAHHADLYLTALSIILCLIFLAGMILQPPRRALRLGPDSWCMLILYALGMAGLVFVHT